jgi:DinB superfamily
MASTHDALSTVLNELFDGSANDSGWVLNPKDPGLLRSLSALSAADASAIPAGGRSSIAAHVDHLRYGLSLLNRWSQGEENPFAGADWTASWKRTKVSEPEWSTLRNELQSEARKWQVAVREPREFSDDELNGYLASAAHLAYHLGAIRQMNAAARGPADSPKT